VTAAYAGDIDSRRAWSVLESDPDAVLVDVRTEPEWSFVGLPDLSALSRRPVCVSWQVYPHMAVNQSFADDVRAHGVNADRTVLLLCRSGQRSRSAAMDLVERGYERAYNVADGFEGPPDSGHRRGRIAGWKAAGLPWIQG